MSFKSDQVILHPVFFVFFFVFGTFAADELYVKTEKGLMHMPDDISIRA